MISSKTILELWLKFALPFSAPGDGVVASASCGVSLDSFQEQLSRVQEASALLLVTLIEGSEDAALQVSTELPSNSIWC